MNNSKTMFKSNDPKMKRFGLISEYELISSQMYELRTRTSLSLDGRIKIVDEMIANVNKTVRTQPLSETVFCHIFKETSELLDPSQPFEIRKRIWKFYTQLIQRKSEAVGQLRYSLFELVNKYDCKNDEMALKIDFLIGKFFLFIFMINSLFLLIIFSF